MFKTEVCVHMKRRYASIGALAAACTVGALGYFGCRTNSPRNTFTQTYHAVEIPQGLEINFTGSEIISCNCAWWEEGCADSPGEFGSAKIKGIHKKNFGSNERYAMHGIVYDPQAQRVEMKIIRPYEGALGKVLEFVFRREGDVVAGYSWTDDSGERERAFGMTQFKLKPGRYTAELNVEGKPKARNGFVVHKSLDDNLK